MESAFKQHLLHLHSPACIVRGGLHKVILAACRGAEHRRKTILCRVRNTRAEHIRDPANQRCAEVPTSRVPHIQLLEGATKELVRGAQHRDALPCVAKYLRGRDHEHVVVGIPRHRRCIGLGIGHAIIRTRIHTEVCQILYDHNIVLCGRLANYLQLSLGECYPRGVIGRGVDNGRYISRGELLFELRAECLTTVFENLERAVFNT